MCTENCISFFSLLNIVDEIVQIFKKKFIYFLLFIPKNVLPFLSLLFNKTFSVVRVKMVYTVAASSLHHSLKVRQTNEK